MITEGATKRRGRRWDAEGNARSREINLAIWRIIKGTPGEGGIAADLAVLTGLTPNAVFMRYKEVEYDYPEDEKNSPGLSSKDIKMIKWEYRDSDDPTVKRFLQDNLSN